MSEAAAPVGARSDVRVCADCGARGNPHALWTGRLIVWTCQTRGCVSQGYGRVTLPEPWPEAEGCLRRLQDDPYRGCAVYDEHGACVCSTTAHGSCADVEHIRGGRPEHHNARLGVHQDVGVGGRLRRLRRRLRLRGGVLRLDAPSDTGRLGAADLLGEWGPLRRRLERQVHRDIRTGVIDG